MSELMPIPKEAIEWIPTESDIRSFTEDNLVIENGDTSFHLVEVSCSGVNYSTQPSPQSLVKHLQTELKILSGGSSKIFIFLGTKLEFTKPQVMVGLSTPNQKRQIPIFLQKGDSNPDGSVPSISFE